MMTRMAKQTMIACCVTPETKVRVRALAERQGITESILVRQLLDGALKTSGLEESVASSSRERMNRDARLQVRLESTDLHLLKERAMARGMASATYVSLWLRAHLRGAPPLPKAEYIALMQSIEATAALGRNLNQIARTLNQGGRPELPGRHEVLTMIKVAEALRDQFRALLSANQRSWEDGNAES